MNGPVILYGGTLKERKAKVKEYTDEVEDEEYLQINVPKDKNSIGIEQIREAIKFTANKPIIGKKKGIIITNGEKMTKDAQNALLKTLEELPSYVSFIICTPTLNALLETIQSRCILKDIKMTDSTFTSEDSKLYEKVKYMSFEEKFSWAQETAKEEKEVILDMLDQWISIERSHLLINDRAVNNIALITRISDDLSKTNINTRLALETLIINLH